MKDDLGRIGIRLVVEPGSTLVGILCAGCGKPIAEHDVIEGETAVYHVDCRPDAPEQGTEARVMHNHASTALSEEPLTDTPTIDWPAERIAELLGQITLTRGHHSDGAEACAMDLIGMAIQGEWTDTPACVHEILARAVHRINDHPNTTTEERLALVLDAGPHLIGTAGPDRTPWAVMVAHRAGLTAAGLVAALTGTPPGADLSGADLSGAYLSGAYLSGADLSGADLYGAYLYGADLSRADLSRADLYGAYLYGANLSRANLSGANLSGANLSGANLSGANLSRANLSGANLSRAYLSRAYLSRADLSRANLYGANLYGAYLSGADLYGANLSGAYLSRADRLDEARNVPEDVLVAWKTAQTSTVDVTP